MKPNYIKAAFMGVFFSLLGYYGHLFATRATGDAQCDLFLQRIKERDYTGFDTADIEGEPTLVLYRKGYPVSYFHGGLWFGRALTSDTFPRDTVGGPDCGCSATQIHDLLSTHRYLKPAHERAASAADALK